MGKGLEPRTCKNREWTWRSTGGENVFGFREGLVEHAEKLWFIYAVPDEQRWRNHVPHAGR